MWSDRRLITLLVAALGIAVPATVLVALCAGRACERAVPSTGQVPFCSLPSDIRRLLEAGFRDGRSPHVMAVTTGSVNVAGSTGVHSGPRSSALWPSVDMVTEGTVPLVFTITGPNGPEVRFLPDVPDGTRLDAVAPTISDIIGLNRPHPGVRSGRALPREGSPDAPGERPRLVLLVVWKGVGSIEVDHSRLPNLLSLNQVGSGTAAAQVGSLPLDPAAVLATIGTGGLPRDHGITGTLVRNDRGQVVRAWDRGSPFSVIAALGDDLDEIHGQAARIGVVGTDISDRGLIGGNWYLEHDRDDLVVAGRPSAQVAAAQRVLASGYGDDAVPDLLAVAMEGSLGLGRMDGALGALTQSAAETTNGSVLVVVTATGSGAVPPKEAAQPASATKREVRRLLGADVIETSALGGLFLDQQALAKTGVTDDGVVDALQEHNGPGGGPLFADVFPQVAVTFAKYC